MCACAHFICLPPFPLADFKEQAGRTHGRHNHVRAPSVVRVIWGRHRVECGEVGTVSYKC